MILSQLTLNPMNRQARTDIARPYNLHRTLSRAFVNNEEVEKFLFRTESGFSIANKGLIVLVQSANYEPDYSLISDKFPGYFTNIEQRTISNSRLEQSLQPGATFYFRLVANPTHKREGRKYGLYTQEEQLAWLRRKSELSGFAPVSVNIADFIIGNKAATQSQSSKPRKDQIYNIGARYDGILKVTDSSLMFDSMLRGIGPSKSFGFGLITLKRYSE